MKKYVVLYDPKEHVKKEHKCDLPDLTRDRHNEDTKIWWKTIVECEECAKRWVALTYTYDPLVRNKWTPLRWYHFKWQRNLRR